MDKGERSLTNVATFETENSGRKGVFLIFKLISIA